MPRVESNGLWHNLTGGASGDVLEAHIVTDEYGRFSVKYQYTLNTLFANYTKFGYLEDCFTDGDPYTFVTHNYKEAQCRLSEFLKEDVIYV